MTDFLDLSTRGGASSASKGSGVSLAQKLGNLHSVPAPIPEGKEGGRWFGFGVPTCCGSTVQENEWTESWEGLFGERR